MVKERGRVRAVIEYKRFHPDQYPSIIPGVIRQGLSVLSEKRVKVILADTDWSGTMSIETALLLAHCNTVDKFEGEDGKLYRSSVKIVPTSTCMLYTPKIVSSAK